MTSDVGNWADGSEHVCVCVSGFVHALDHESFCEAEIRLWFGSARITNHKVI